MLKQLVESFVTLFVVLDPVGSIPIFLIATADLCAADRSGCFVAHLSPPFSRAGLVHACVTNPI